MKGHQFLRSKHQCACTIRISSHARERLAEALGVPEVSVERAQILLRDAQMIDAEAAINLGYRPRPYGRLSEGQSSYYLRIIDSGREALAVMTDDLQDLKLVWVTTYKLDDVTKIRRAITDHRMGRRARKKFLKRRRGG